MPQEFDPAGYAQIAEKTGTSWKYQMGAVSFSGDEGAVAKAKEAMDLASARFFHKERTQTHLIRPTLSVHLEIGGIVINHYEK